jgi:uncharacterized protein (DUF1697 family)
MTSHIAFLRAINLGARRKFAKGDIAAAVAHAGGTEIETYINTGNVRFDHLEGDPDVVRRALEAAFLQDRDFEVPTIVLTPQELTTTAHKAHELIEENSWAQRSYAYLLQGEWDPERAAELEALSVPTVEQLVVSGRAAHLLIADVDSYHKSPFTNAKIEKFLPISTNRNFNVITTLAQKWGT